MKKIFAIALVGLVSLTFVENANAFENDNEIVFSAEVNDAPVDVITFEIVPVATEFVFNVADETVNYFASVEGFGSAVNTEGFEITNSFETSSTFVDVPIDYGIYSKTEFTLNEPLPILTKPIDYGSIDSNVFTLTKAIDIGIISTNYFDFTLSEPLPNLNEYNYDNSTNGYANDSTESIASNTGKLTS
jgi:hypothetical protein